MKFLKDNRKFIALFLLTAAVALAQVQTVGPSVGDDPASKLAFKTRDIVIGISVAIAEIILAFGFIRAGLNLMRGGIFIAQGIVVAICVTHIETIVAWAQSLSL